MRRYKTLQPLQHQTLRIRSRGTLPHWEVDDAIYSVTYRLIDSLPRAVVERLKRDRVSTLEKITGGHRGPNAVERAEIDRLFSLRLDQYLDQGYGSCHLRRPEMASIVAENLHHFDDSRYRLHAWCVMPNHVHVLFHLRWGKDLSRVLHSWKSYTSHRASEILGTRRFWQKEYFDRVVRDEEDFIETRSYILDNPAKAGLRNWRWSWSRNP